MPLRLHRTSKSQACGHRALGLSQKKSLTCLGEATPELIFAKKSKNSSVRPPSSDKPGCLVSPHVRGIDPDSLLLRPRLMFSTFARGYPCALLHASSAIVVRCGVTLRCILAARDCISATAGGCRSLRDRHLAPPTSFSGLFLSAAQKRKPPAAAFEIGE